jgi:hypothetical protein
MCFGVEVFAEGMVGLPNSGFYTLAGLFPLLSRNNSDCPGAFVCSNNQAGLFFCLNIRCYIITMRLLFTGRGTMGRRIFFYIIVLAAFVGLPSGAGSAASLADPTGSLRILLYDPAEASSYQVYAVYRLGSSPAGDPVREAWVSGDPTLFHLPVQEGVAYTVWGAINVPGFRRVLLELDNDGEGYAPRPGELLQANFAYEVARTELRKLQERLDGGLAKGHTFSPEILQLIESARASLEQARLQQEGGNPAEASRVSYEILGQIIPAKEALALEIARQDIRAIRPRQVVVTIVDAAGSPLPGLQVTYEQDRQDFALSSWLPNMTVWSQNDAGWDITESYAYYRALARDTGFEMSTVGLAWGTLARDPERPLRYDEDMTVRWLSQDGFSLNSAGTVYFSDYFPGMYPPVADQWDHATLLANAEDYVSAVVGHYKGEIQMWNLLNEPNYANAPGLSQDETYALMESLISASRAADPDALAGINLAQPGFERTAPDEFDDNNPMSMATYDIAAAMQQRGIDADYVGLQLYYGAYEPPIDLGTLSDLFDVFARDFDYKFFIQEFEYPTHDGYSEHEEGVVDYRWGEDGTSREYQAYWGSGVYTLAMSKPNFIGANWMLGCDLPAGYDSRRLGDGLLEQDCLTPRPILSSLKDLFASWRSDGEALSDDSGQVRFGGFAGTYRLTITSAQGAVLQQTVHMGDGENRFTIQFDEPAVLADNAQAAYSSITDLEQKLALLEAGGKTAGLPEARELLAQARAANENGQFAAALAVAQQGTEAISFQMDGKADDWAQIPPISNLRQDQEYVQSIHIVADNEALYILIVPVEGLPAMEYQFHMLASTPGTDGTIYDLQTYPWYGLFAPEGQSPFTDGIRDCEIAYGDVVEIRLPLEAMGYPEKLSFEWINAGLDWTGFEMIGTYQLELPARVAIATIIPQPYPVAPKDISSDGATSSGSDGSGGGVSYLSPWLLVGAGVLILALVLVWFLRRRR